MKTRRCANVNDVRGGGDIRWQAVLAGLEEAVAGQHAAWPMQPIVSQCKAGESPFYTARERAPTAPRRGEDLIAAGAWASGPQNGSSGAVGPVRARTGARSPTRRYRRHHRSPRTGWERFYERGRWFWGRVNARLRSSAFLAGLARQGPADERASGSNG